MKKLILILLLLILTMCKKEESEVEVILNSGNTEFNDVFKLKEKFKIKTDNKKEYDIFSINKIIEPNDSSYIICDNINNTILLISKSDNSSKIIAKTGIGPGEFEYLADVIFTKGKQIIGIDYSGFFNVYNASGNFLKKIKMAYEHRTPESITECKNGNLIIGAEKNLIDKSTKDSYHYTNFEERCYLNMYDKNFNLVKSFFNPDSKFDKTMSYFLRTQYKMFAPLTLIDDVIVSMLQDGLYNIYTFTCNGDLIKKYKVVSKNFHEFEFEKLTNHKVINGRSNFSIRKKGEVIASHSSPASIYSVNQYILVTIIEPYDNSFPQFSKMKLSFHLDIFMYKNNELIPMVSGINLDKEIIGVGRNNVIFMKKIDGSKRINDITIYKYKLSDLSELDL